jgi:GTPase
LLEHALEAFDEREAQHLEPIEQAPPSTQETEEIDAVEERKALRIAVVGRPNVGKSTLINGLVGEVRVIAYDQPGTTRDSIAVDFERGGKPYVLVDTAGVRRRGKVTEVIEKFSVIKTLQAIDASQVVILVIDSSEGVSDQDAQLAGYILESGRALVVALNKWDKIELGLRERATQEYHRKMHFLKFANMHFTCALDGFGIAALMRSVDAAWKAATLKMPTPKLTRAILDAIQRQAPARSGLSRPKMRYAHQGGQNPPRVIVHGSGLGEVQASYVRFLESWLRTKFDLTGTPLRIEFRNSHNPFEGKCSE